MKAGSRTIVIAGGAGFLGSHLTDRFIERGHEVIVLDNLTTGKRDNVNKKAIFINMDVSNAFDILSLSSISKNIDEVYHLASIASPPIYQAYPYETIQANTTGTYNLLQFAEKKKALFTYASTSEIYGDPLEIPQKESYFGNVNSFGPRSCYDESKRLGETICYMFKDKVNLKIARIFNTYGPRMNKHDGRVLTNFIHNALDNYPLIIYGGHQTRSFCYYLDTIRALDFITHSETKETIFNIGNPLTEVSISELASMVIKLTGSKSVIEFWPLPQDDPQVRCPNILRINKEVAWKPRVGLEEGLLKMIEYIKKEREVKV